MKTSFSLTRWSSWVRCCRLRGSLWDCSYATVVGVAGNSARTYRWVFSLSPSLLAATSRNHYGSKSENMLCSYGNEHMGSQHHLIDLRQTALAYKKDVHYFPALEAVLLTPSPKSIHINERCWLCIIILNDLTSPLLRRPYSCFRLASKLILCSSVCWKACRTRQYSISRLTIGEKGCSRPMGLDSLMEEDILAVVSITNSASSSESPGGSLAMSAPSNMEEWRLMDLLLVLVLVPISEDQW